MSEHPPKMANTANFKSILKQGKGRSIVLLVEQGSRFCETAKNVGVLLAQTHSVLVIEVPSFDEHNWDARAEELLVFLSAERVRFACYLGFGSAATLLQYLFLADAKKVRSLILIDATTRPHPSIWTRFLSRVEATLPIGLPLRSSDTVFNGKPFLQRIRCPALVLTSKSASAHELSEASALVETLPTAWHDSISEDENEEVIATIVKNFQDIAAKCPQKNRPQ